MSNIVCDFLEVFYTAVKEYSGAYYFTAQFVIAHINNIANNFKKYKKNPIFTNTYVLMK